MNPEPGATSLHHQEVPVWFRRTEHLTARDIAHADGTLSASERARADRFRFPDARRDYVIAHDLLRRSLSRYGSIAPAAWQFDVGAHGRPFLRRAEGQPPIFFSLTHTTGLVACAIAREPWVGVDVERTSRTLTRLDIGARILSPVEAHALDRCEESERRLRLFELWTLKEACAKAAGLGFLIGFRGLSFSIEGTDLRFTPPPSLSERRWSAALFAPTADSRLAVAIGQSGPDRARVSVRDADAERHVLAPLRATREDVERV